MASLRPNRVKQKMSNGDVAVGVMGPVMTADLIDVLGPMGFDAVWLEGEHGPVDFGDIPDLTRAADLWGMTSIVRVNENRYGPIYRTLDLGSQGVCVPHVDTRDQAQAVADAAKFAPLGKRGIATSRQGYGVPDFFEAANAESLAIILIEDIVAVENLDEILEVEGVDLFYVAPGDLGQSLGHLDRTHPEVLATVDNDRCCWSASWNAGDDGIGVSLHRPRCPLCHDGIYALVGTWGEGFPHGYGTRALKS